MKQAPDNNPQAAPDEGLCVVPRSIYDRVEQGLGKYFEPISGFTPEVAALDMLDARKALRHHAILRRYVDPVGKKILEVGTGYGTNLIVWVSHFGLDVKGIEPEGEGFASTIDISRDLCRENGVDPERIVSSPGEHLPFPDDSFDVVYSSNVLEHTQDPQKVLEEAFRILRPGGLLHFEIPNFLAPFEGHYFIVMPPILWKGLLPFWVKWVFGRDPGFARTLRTEINPAWLRRTVKRLGSRYRLRLISLGEEVFRERLRATFRFETRTGATKLGPIIRVLRVLNFKDVVSRSLILARAHYPIYLTVLKEGPRDTP